MHDIQTNSDLDLNEINHNGRKIFLVGTAHVSKKSADLVEEIIEKTKPERVCIELCEPRAHSLRNPDRWSETNIFTVIKSGRAYLLLAQLLLSSYQKRLATKFGIQPGEEMRRAISICEKEEIPMSFVDREIRLTLKRAWGTASLWSLTKLMVSLIASSFSDEDISEETIEDLKSGDALMVLMKDFAEVLPGVKEALIDERDRYMATKILQSEGSSIVAVVGAGHVPGILKHFGEEFDLEKLEEIPPPRKLVKAIAWTIPAIIIAMFAYGVSTSGFETGKAILLSWIIANGGLSALGALIARAHPITVITAFVAAPLTSLNPTIGAGWVCGIVEAFLRKPRVKDLETVSEDIASIKGFYDNRVTRILLVMALSNLGSVFGTLIGAGKIASIL